MSFSWAKATIAGLALLVGLLGGTKFLFPYEFNYLEMSFWLWRAQVHEVRAGNFQGLERNECQQSLGCSCILFLNGEEDDAASWANVLAWPEERWKKVGMDRPLRLVALNLPGAAGELRSRRIAESLKDALPGLCPNWVVVGNGLGGAVGAWLALVWPEGVGRLILMGSRGLAVQRTRSNDLGGEPSRASMREYLARAYFTVPVVSDRLVDEMIERGRRLQTQRWLAAQTEEDDLDLRLTMLLAPTLFLWGEADRITPLSDGRSMRTLLPNGIIREVKNCGHYIQKECPTALLQGINDMVKYGAM